MSTVTERLLGISTGPTRPPNTYPVWAYVLILVVILLGAIYAMPNLYPPDHAVQIRAEAVDARVSPAVVDAAVEVLEEAGIRVIGTELAERQALIRVGSQEEQLRGRGLVQGRLADHAAAAGDPRGYVVALNMAPTTPAWLQRLGARPLALGLDLSGGVHFMLEVDMPRALNDRMRAQVDTIQSLLRDARIRYMPGPVEDWIDGSRLTIAFQTPEARDQAQLLLAETYPDYTIMARPVSGRPGLWLTLGEDRIREIEDYAIDQNLVSLRNRVNELGVAEPLVQRAGRARIAVDLPGVQDSAEAKRILDRFATLEFRLVAPPDALAAETERFVYEGRQVLLERMNIVTGEQVINARQDYDPETQMPQVSITLDGAGGERMHQVTRRNVGVQMAIIFTELRPHTRIRIVDGDEIEERYVEEEQRVISVAVIRSAFGHRFRITGLGIGEARELALLLRAGALAAPMYIVEERTVGASLGEENIRQGRNAMILGYALVILFMLGYYRMFGLAANLALTINVILIVALLSVLGATLTLPGIAGLVLTVGMAVDANVLIFSRIREELKTRSPQLAIQAGFERALSTILDANITTMFVALILLAIGTGPVRGFAVVLSLGILTSVFTAIVITRALINLMYGGRSVERLAI
jgi:preprotein translocase subunit SecD